MENVYLVIENWKQECAPHLGEARPTVNVQPFPLYRSVNKIFKK